MELQKILSVRQNFLKLLLIFLSRHLFLQDALPKNRKSGLFTQKETKRADSLETNRLLSFSIHKVNLNTGKKQAFDT